MVNFLNRKQYYTDPGTGGGGTSQVTVPAKRVQLRRGTDAEFLQMQDEIIGRGEPVICYLPNNVGQYGVDRGKILFVCFGDGINKLKNLPQFLPDTGVQAKGRAMRDISSAGGIVNQTTGKDFATQQEAIEALLYLYSAPSFSFQSNGLSPVEVNTTQNVNFLISNLTPGTYPLLKKEIIDADNNVILQSEVSAATTNVAANNVSVTKATNGVRTFNGEVTNTRPTLQGGNDKRVLQIGFDFRHLVGFGYVGPGVDTTYTDANMTEIFNNVGGAISRNLGNQNQQINAAQNLSKAIVFVPAYMSAITGIYQNSQPSNIRPLFDVFQRNISRLVNPGPGQTVLYTILYNIYIQKNPTGSGGVNKYDFNG